MTSLLPTIQAKSDQLNAEDLIGGPRTIKITGVQVSTSEDQPVSISFEGDGKKPFKPCKTVRRLLVRVWGDNADDYAGRLMTIYLDDSVKYGGMAVGGIRVSHLSDIDAPKKFFLTETRGRKREVTIKPLKVNSEKKNSTITPDKTELNVAKDDLDNAKTIDELQKAWLKNAPMHTVSEFELHKNKRKADLLNQDSF